MVNLPTELIVLTPSIQKCCVRGQDHTTCRNVPSSSVHLEHLSVWAGYILESLRGTVCPVKEFPLNISIPSRYHQTDILLDPLFPVTLHLWSLAPLPKSSQDIGWYSGERTWSTLLEIKKYSTTWDFACVPPQGIGPVPNVTIASSGKT